MTEKCEKHEREERQQAKTTEVQPAMMITQLDQEKKQLAHRFRKFDKDREDFIRD